MDETFDGVLAVLQRFISPVNARALLMRVLKEEGVRPETLTPAVLRRCSGALRRGIGLFVPQSQREAAMREITEFCGSDSLKPVGCRLEIREEMDIGRVRAEARRICTTMGTTSFAMQRVATIVSELARNMVLYANGGVVEIVPANSGSKRIVVRAEDRGAGIRNLDEIMSGRYKSRTGMGKGLMGTKRLSDHFEIETNSRGTRVVAEVNV
ncbi:MAG TPA: ATP-binding protein [Polyangiaceae bacterium]|nr:ATP-binding protein [Polyangiaceae bacterium]